MILRNIGVILTILVGIEHIGIMWLEIFGKPDLQAKSFDMDINFVKQPAAKTALANQGIYNGMLGLLILIVFFFFRMPTLITIWQLLLAFVVVVAIFGGFTASKKIFCCSDVTCVNCLYSTFLLKLIKKMRIVITTVLIFLLNILFLLIPSTLELSLISINL